MSTQQIPSQVSLVLVANDTVFLTWVSVKVSRIDFVTVISKALPVQPVYAAEESWAAR
jgi:hypothetical protein